MKNLSHSLVLLLIGCTNINNMGTGSVIYQPSVKTGGDHAVRKVQAEERNRKAEKVNGDIQ